MTEIQGEVQGASEIKGGVKVPSKETRFEVVGKIGEFEITQNPDAQNEAFRLRTQMLEAFAKHTGLNSQELVEKMRDNPASADPMMTYEEFAFLRQINKFPDVIAASVWDFNGCLSENRDGFSSTQTFHPALKEAVKKQQDRLGSFVIATALTTEQMVYHVAKEEDIVGNILLSCENGRAWAIPIKEGDKTIFVEYRQTLEPEQKKALGSVKEISGRLAKLLRENGKIAFVNDQKFSKCTIECATNGRDWYNKTIKELVLPFLKKNGAGWDGESNVFSIDGQLFSISPTPDTWEIDPVEGTDRIGKRFIREGVYNTLVDIIHDKKGSARFKMITGGDSVRFGGSDAGLTDSNVATVPFWVPSSERKVEDSLKTVEEGMMLGRKYWPSYIEDGEKARLAGPGVAPAFFMDAVGKMLPHLKIPTEVFSAALIKRLTGVYGFREYKRYDLSQPANLYVFPSDMTEEQKEMFLKSKSDIPADDQEKVLASLKIQAGV